MTLQENTPSASEPTSAELPGRSSLAEFVHRLEEIFGAHKRSEQYIFQFCWDHRDVVEAEGKDLFVLFDECRTKVGLANTMTARFRAWFKVRSAVPPEVADRLPTKTAVYIARAVADDKIAAVAHRAVQEGAETRGQIKRIAGEMGAESPSKPRRPNLDRKNMRRIVKRWRAALNEAAGAKRAETIRRRIAELRAEMEEWLINEGN